MSLERRHTLQIVALLALGAAQPSCGRARAQAEVQPVSDAAVSTTTATEAPTRPPPLESTPSIATLAVPGFSDAVISVPLGARSPRPILVATHGLWDFPEGLCDNWRWIIGNRAWVLCPRGEPMPDKTFLYKSGPALAKEIEAGIKALDERYPGYVDTGPRTYTGFSLGAILGVWIVTHDPAHYPRSILTEGGEDRFTDAAAAAYARGGGQRVLFACGLKGRVAEATHAARRLQRAGVPSRVVLGKLPATGQFIHWYNGPVAEETKGQLGWLFEDDARWSE